MTAQAVETVVAQLADAGLNLSLAPAGGLAVAPSSHLTADLRALIRSSKALLIDWLTAANDAASHAPDLPVNPQDWKELAAAYHAHVNGAGNHKGDRTLWRSVRVVRCA